MKIKTTFEGSTGFTLVELLVTIAIMGILMSMAMSDSTEVRQRENIDRTAQSLMDFIHFSQDYARHLSAPSAVCAGTPADQCQSTDWSQGWTLFRTNQQDVSADLEAVRTFEITHAGTQILLNGMQDTSKITINGEGFILGANNATNAVVCDGATDYHSLLEVQKTQTQMVSYLNPTIISEKCQNGSF